MFRKPYYGSKIAPACAYCLHGAPAADPKNYDEQGIPIRPKAKGRDER